MASEYAKQFLLKTVSVLSTSDVRYEGRLYLIDDQACQIALQNVRCLGTEGRKAGTGHEIPASDQTYEYIMFKPENVKRLFTSGTEREQDLTISVLQPLQQLKKEGSRSRGIESGSGSGDGSTRHGGGGDGGGRSQSKRRGYGGRGSDRGHRSRDRRPPYQQHPRSDRGTIMDIGGGIPMAGGPLSDFYRGSYAEFGDSRGSGGGDVRYFGGGANEHGRRDPPPARYEGGGGRYPSYRGGYDRYGYDRAGPPPGPPPVIHGPPPPGPPPVSQFYGGRGGGGGGPYYGGGGPYYGGQQRGRGRGRGGGYRYGRGGYRSGPRRRGSSAGRAGTGAFLNEYSLSGEEIRVDTGEFDFGKAREKAEKELSKADDDPSVVGSSAVDAKVDPSPTVVAEAEAEATVAAATATVAPVSHSIGMPESEFYSEGKPAYDQSTSFFDCLTIDSRKGLMTKDQEKEGSAAGGARSAQASQGGERKEESKAEVRRSPDEAQKIRDQIAAQNTQTFGTVADGYRARSFRYRNRHPRGGGNGYPMRGRGPYYDRGGAPEFGSYRGGRYREDRRSGGRGYIPFSDAAQKESSKRRRQDYSASKSRSHTSSKSEAKESRSGKDESYQASKSQSKQRPHSAQSSDSSLGGKVWVKRQS